MRRRITPWSRSIKETTETKEDAIFQPKRMNLPQFTRVEEVQEPQTNTEPPPDPQEDSEEEEVEEQEVLDLLRNQRGKHGRKSRKRRGNSISVCVSDEEEAILRASAAAAGMSFSEWARRAMFKAAKVKMPKR
jgi:predicted DNA binding CopG/RHH family protein